MVSSGTPRSGRADWSDEVEIVGSTVVPPDPRIMDAIGLNYAIEAAVADLVDNSIDAGAANVLVRFVRRGPRLVSLCVVDNGRGMDETGLEQAMALGRRRDYEPGDLGHFGLGLKAASLGQARSLTVISRAPGSTACGRRWLAGSARDGFECDVVGREFSAMLLSRPWGALTLHTGTIVRWDGVTDFPGALDARTTNAYIERSIPRLRNHLGLVFHRLIADGTVMIDIDVEEPGIGETGPPQPVIAIDPFGYQRSGRPDYPRTLAARLDAGTVNLACHIWPPNSQLPGFRVPRSGDHQGQGLYFYRHDRLLQAGGWNGLVHPERSFQLARIAVDVGDGLAEHLSMNPEKTRIRASEAFIQAVESARCGEFDLKSHREDAVQRLRESRKPAGTRRRVIPPGRGLAPAVRRAIGEELEFVAGADPVDIRWHDFDDERFFDLDLDGREIRLNRRYRWAVTGDGGAALNDAPLLKAALYLLLNDLFQGEYLGPREKDNVELWGAILGAAARVEAT